MTDEELEDLYQDHVLRHAEHSRYRGGLAAPTWTCSVRNPLCGDVVRLELAVDDDGRVAQAVFEGSGCLISQAAASILCEFVEGKHASAVAEFSEQRMLDLLGVPLTPTRRRCALLARSALSLLGR